MSFVPRPREGQTTPALDLHRIQRLEEHIAHLAWPEFYGPPPNPLEKYPLDLLCSQFVGEMSLWSIRFYVLVKLLFILCAVHGNG